MSSDHIEKNPTTEKGSEDPEKQPSSAPLNAYTDRRSGQDRRSGTDRRTGDERRAGQRPFQFQDRRTGEDRRSGLDRRTHERRKKRIRIPIFIKLATLSILLTLFVIAAIGFSMLSKQRQQFTDQLMDLGKSMVRIAATNAPDKLLGEEDLALFQLVNGIAGDEQVLYALIVDAKNMIKAHSLLENVNRPYVAPKHLRLVRRDSAVKISKLLHRGEEILFFQSPITYKNLKVGEVHIAISQKVILQNIREAKFFIFVLATVITLLGVLLSLRLSMYFSGPIRKLGETTKALGMGDFKHRVRIDRNDEFGDLAYSFNRMAEDLELNERVKDSFGRYVTPEIVDMILTNPDNQWMKGAKVEATVLFVDIRGFTSISEDKEPEGMVELLNEYFTRVTDAVIKYGGHINKFVGDEAMAVFGAPVLNPHHARSAVKAALDIQQEISKLNWENKTKGISIPVGIGVNSGEMVAGNVGSQKRMEYTVIGDNVNVASRITSLAKGGEILITKRTYELIGEENVKVQGKGKVPVKGRKMGIRIFKVLSLEKEQWGERRQYALQR